MANKIIICLVVCCCCNTSSAQPYLDLVSTSAQWTPNPGVYGSDEGANVLKKRNINVNAPVVVRDSSLIVIGGSLDFWKVGVMYVDTVNLNGITASATFVKPLTKKVSSALSILARWNGSQWFDFHKSNQVGGALLVTFKQNINFKYRVGLYYNKEFFGSFLMPLGGIEWKINSQNIIYGVLPGNMTWENKVTKDFYWGLCFRAITTSYRNNPGSAPHQFIRINDNQVNSFADVYLTKHLVLSGELGYSLFREVRTGETGRKVKYNPRHDMDDNLLLRIGLSFRFRTG